MGRYKLIELIGQGGMGNVYLAEDTRLDRKKVAVKIILEDSCFVQEALVAPRIDHENIIDVTDRGKTPEGVPFFVMEYLKGSDLGAVISKEGVLPWCERTRDIVLQMCRGLSAAHEKGIVHRDMKSENVFLVERSDNRVFIKLFDFGIAKLLESVHEEKGQEKQEHGSAPLSSIGAGITQAGSVKGTPDYMAPEQAAGADIDHRVDIYAVGTIMYEMLCGCVPFVLQAKENPLADAFKILDMQRTQQPVPPRARRPDLAIPEEVEAVVMKALSKNRDDRFRTMKDMEEAIMALEVPQDGQPFSCASAKGQVSMKEFRPGSKAMIGYAAIVTSEKERRRKAIVKAIVAASAAAAIGLVGAKSCERIPKHEQPSMAGSQTGARQTHTDDTRSRKKPEQMRRDDAGVDHDGHDEDIQLRKR